MHHTPGATRAERPDRHRFPAAVTGSLFVALLALAACGSDSRAATTTTSTASVVTAGPSSTSVASTSVASTSVASTSVASTSAPATSAPNTEAPSSAAPTTAPASASTVATTDTVTPVPSTGAVTSTTRATPAVPGTGPCDGSGAIPAAATHRQVIHGDIDGDRHDDTVTAYTLDGTPHIHARLFIGQQSDATIPLGFADTVTIGFEDIDHSAGAAVPPPVAVMAVGAGNAGSAFIAFLTLTPKYCIRQWSQDDAPFTDRISQQDPYSGLVCDGTAGSIHYLLVNAEQQPGGQWKVTTRELKHNFTKALLTPLPDQLVPDAPDIATRFGDIVDCTHPALF
jgi:hypothetical protein